MLFCQYKEQLDEIVLVSCCCCNRSPQTQWLKTTRIYYLIVVQIWSPKWVSLSYSQGVGKTGSFRRLQERISLLAVLSF